MLILFISGKFDVHVKWNGRHIPKSPFRVEVGQDLDASQAYATGPGLEPKGIQAGKYTDFTVFTEGAGEGQVSVKVIDPRGGEDVDIIIEPQEDGKFFVEYQPVNAGKHTIKVMFGGQPISRSPFHVVVSPPRVEPIPSKVRVFGTGKFGNSLYIAKICCTLHDCCLRKISRRPKAKKLGANMGSVWCCCKKIRHAPRFLLGSCSFAPPFINM